MSPESEPDETPSGVAETHKPGIIPVNKLKPSKLVTMNSITIDLDRTNRIVITKDTDTDITTVEHFAFGFGDAGDEWKVINSMNCDGDSDS